VTLKFINKLLIEEIPFLSRIRFYQESDGAQSSKDIDLLNSRLLWNLKNKNEFKNVLHIMARKEDCKSVGHLVE
jgi:hypothetical protein